MEEIIYKLKKLEDIWDDDYLLFASSGTLVLVDINTGRVIEEFPYIQCDGGDTDYRYIDGEEYIEDYIQE